MSHFYDVVAKSKGDPFGDEAGKYQNFTLVVWGHADYLHYMAWMRSLASNRIRLIRPTQT